KWIFGSRNDREVRKLWPLVHRINEIEAGLQKLSDDELRQKTAEFKTRIEEGRKARGYYEQMTEVRKLESELRSDEAKTQRRQAFDIEQQLLDEILPEAFAVVKNACRRLCGQEIIVRDHPIKWEMIPFDVQLIGGIGLHRGFIAEMATGEGNALAGHGAHLVTVNDYLAARDSEWMGAIYKFLGLTVGCIVHDQPPPVRREQYNCDITYGPIAEAGFGYVGCLRLALRKED